MQVTINSMNGALRISLDQTDGWAEDRQFAQGGLAETIADRIREDGNEINILGDLFEPYWTNNGFEPFDAGQANPFVGLTEAPCISEHALMRDDNGKQSIQPGDRVWWYPDYGVRNPLDVLLDRGVVEFPLGFKADADGAPV